MNVKLKKKICFFFDYFIDDTTWFHSDIKLNHRHILDSIQPKTIAEYKQEKEKQQDQYRKEKKKWPHLSEYDEQFVLETTAEQTQKTEYV
jgi:hypothetical protein